MPPSHYPHLPVHWPSNLHVPSSYNSSTLTGKHLQPEVTAAPSGTSRGLNEHRCLPPPTIFVFFLCGWVGCCGGLWVTCIRQMHLFAFASGRPDPSNCTKTLHGRSLAQRKHRALYQEKLIMDTLENSTAVISVLDKWSFDRCKLRVEALIYFVSLKSFHYSEKTVNNSITG